MLLFMPEHQEPILAGRKTETRRIWKLKRARVGSVHRAKTRMLSKECFAFLKILAVYKQRLGDITDESIRDEGYESLEGYKAALEKANRTHGFKWDDNLEVYVIKFKLLDDAIENGLYGNEVIKKGD